MQKDVTAAIGLQRVFNNNPLLRKTSEEKCLEEIDAVLTKYGMSLVVNNEVVVVKMEKE